MVVPFDIVNGLALFFFCGWIGNWGMHLFAIVNGILKLHKKCRKRPSRLPGVSILKPLTGVDQNLFDNLETYFTMDYPKYELLFCIEHESDPSLFLVKKLIQKYPDIDASVFIGAPKVGVNPKINNMNSGYEAAKYDLLLVSDCGIKMKQDTLLEMVSSMAGNVAMVHQMPFSCDRKGDFPDVVEKVFFGTYASRLNLAGDVVRMNVACGMSALMRKRLLDEAGGMRAFSKYLSEDFFFAQSFLDRGWRLRLCSQPAWQNSGICEIEYFQNRVSRWTKLCFAMVPYTVVMEPFSHCLFQGAAAAWAVHFLFGTNVIVVYLMHVAAWITLDWILLNLVQGKPLPFGKMDFFVAWIFIEMGTLYQYCVALADPNIRWRNRVFYLKWGGIAQEVKPAPKNGKRSLFRRFLMI